MLVFLENFADVLNEWSLMQISGLVLMWWETVGFKWVRSISHLEKSIDDIPQFFWLYLMLLLSYFVWVVSICVTPGPNITWAKLDT